MGRFVPMPAGLGVSRSMVPNSLETVYAATC